MLTDIKFFMRRLMIWLMIAALLVGTIGLTGCSDEESVYYGEEYDVEGKLRVDYSPLFEGEYLYSFCIDDVYGDYYMTDPAAFYVDADGEVMFGY